MRTSLSLIAVICALTANAPVALAQPPAPTTEVNGPQEVPRNGAPNQLLAQDVNTFFQDLNGNSDSVVQFQDAFQYVKDARQGYFGANEWFRWWPTFRGEKVQLDNLKIEKIDGQSSTVLLDYTCRTGKYAHSYKEKFLMSWSAPSWNDKQKFWQFVPQAPNEKQTLGNAPLQWAVYIFLQQPDTVSHFRAALSQYKLRSLALGPLQFIQDWNQRFAFTTEYAEEALQPYLKSDYIWVIPGTTQHYKFNGRLSDKALNQINEPAHTILFYEGGEEKPLFHYNGKAAICLVDGHVELVDAEQIKAFKWNP